MIGLTIAYGIGSDQDGFLAFLQMQQQIGTEGTKGLFVVDGRYFAQDGELGGFFQIITRFYLVLQEEQQQDSQERNDNT